MGVRKSGLGVILLISLTLSSTTLHAKSNKNRSPDDDDADVTRDSQPPKTETAVFSQEEKRKQELETLRNQLLIKEVTLTAEQKKQLDELEKELNNKKEIRLPWVTPGSSIMTPVAYGAQWTDVFVTCGVQAPNAFTSKPNGTAAFGFGIGNAQKYVGLEFDIESDGLWPPFTPGGINLKMHHLFSDGTAIAFGWDDAIYWGNPDQGVSFYLVASKFIVLKEDDEKPFSLITFHLGVGDGAYRTLTDIVEGKNAINPFGSVGLRIVAPVSFIVNWTGWDLATGVSVAPFRRFPLVAGASMIGFTHPQGEQLRGIFSLTYSDSVLADSFPIHLFR